MLQPFAEAEQVHGHGRQLGAHLVIEHGELRHDDGQQKDHEADDQRHQQRGIDERGGELFAEGERDFLEADVALQHLLQVAGALAGQQGGGVHDGKAALRLKGRGKRFAGLDAVGHIVQLAEKLGVFLDLAQHLEGAENGQSGADQGEELLVEDEKRLQLDLAPGEARETAAARDAEDVVAGMGKAGAQLLGGGRGLHLLLHPATLIGQFDDELCHSSACRTGRAGLSREIFSVFRVPAFGYLFL